jgi:hypothetical protein
LRKHVPLQIKQEKHQTEHQGAPDFSKKAKNESFKNEDFNFNEDPILEDFYAESPNKKVSPTRVMKHEIKVQETEFKAKGKHEVKEQDKNEEPPQWFAEFMKTVQRIE